MTALERGGCLRRCRDGLQVPFILGADLTMPALLAGRGSGQGRNILTKDKLYVVEKGYSRSDLGAPKVLKRGNDL
jgi:hypothetical protein